MLKKPALYGLVLFVLIFLFSCSKKVSKPVMKLKEIVIIDFNSIDKSKEYTQHYYAGMYLAIKEINKSGGVLSLPIKLVIENDYGNQMDAYMVAEKAVKKRGGLILSGTYLLQPALGLAKYADDNKIPFFSTGVSHNDLIYSYVASNYVFKLKPSDTMHIIALSQKIIDDSSIKNVNIITYTNSQGDYYSDLVKQTILNKRKDIKIIPDIRINKADVDNKNIAEAIYNSYSKNIILAIDNEDIQKLVVNLQNNKSTIGKNIYMLYIGEPEWFEALIKDNPKNWYVSGFPWYAIDSESNKEFINKYKKEYNFKPRFASYLGYISVYLMADAIKKADITSNDVENRIKIAQQLQNATFQSPLGLVKMRADNQSNLGIYAGYFDEYITSKKKNNTTYKILDVRMKKTTYFGEEFLEDVIKSQNIRSAIIIKKEQKFGGREVVEIIER